MSGNVLTAAVLITGSGSEQDGRAFTILEYSGSSAVWKQIRPWEILPEGVCVDLESNATVNTFVSQPDPAGGLPYASGYPVVFRGENLIPDQYAFRVFLPSGGLRSTSGKPTRLQLVEGHVANGITHRRGSSENYYRISIVTATGHAKVSRPGL
jgi:hypothetical protein